MSGKNLSIIVALEHAQENLPEILDRIIGSASAGTEVIIATASADGLPPEVGPHQSEISLVRASEGSRIPHMWATGIRAARGDLVALTTAHCIPEADWVEKLEKLEMAADIAGVGGVFRNSTTATGMNWAIFLLRYWRYAATNRGGEVADIAADNAVYRRNELLFHDELLDHGFWEPEFHKLFRERGLRLVLDPDLKVIHRNRYTFRQFAVQRMEHGTEFGRARASAQSMAGNLAFFLLSPLLPAVFLHKVLSGALGNAEYRSWTFRALPWLVLFMGCWGYGESRGYFLELKKRTKG